MKRQLTPAALAILALLTGLAPHAGAADARMPYIVQLKDEPAASYTGTTSGYAATQPAAGQPYQSRSPAVMAYRNYLGSVQNQVIASVPAAPVLHRYSNVVNGFAAMLSDAEAAQLRANPKVLAVQPDERRRLDTVSTPAFLGLPGGLWSRMAGSAAIKGEDMVIGVIDSGIWPEDAAFFDQVDASGAPVRSGGTLAYGPKPARFTGGCVAATGFVPERDCNNKLIGAKAYDASFKSSGDTLHWTDFAGSPRDSFGNGDLFSGHGGHGSHTASTAAGNAMNPATVGGLRYGPAAGVAPRARIAVYKVCWTYDNPDAEDHSGSQNGCYGGDSVKAIDEAVADGVDAINFSIGGSQTSVGDIVEQAFYRASLAGVFVAASAGNSGPGNQVAHISPWIATVGASTHGRLLKGSVTLGNAVRYEGVSTNPLPLAASALVRAEDAGLGGADASLCFTSSDLVTYATAGQAALDPAKVNGKVVICTRGSNARVDKSLAVKTAGGVGMILVDNGAGLVADVHAVPAVMVGSADGAAIKTYAAAGGSTTAALSAFTLGTSATAPVMAGFSSRGPNKGDGNVLKPDLSAPGVDVIAQLTPPLSAAEHAAIVAGTLTPPPFWGAYNGTSMASPHVAGASLLLKQLHPGWSPAAIKSALMTTAYPTLNDGLAGAQNGRLPWGQGAGHIDPNKAADPGLVYDMGKADYVRYQCLVNRSAVSAECPAFGTLDHSYNLNLPSITVAAVPDAVTVRRAVSNVGAAAATYTASVEMPGFDATVSPSSLTLQPGETKSFTLALKATTAVKNVWNFGRLTWSDGSHQVVSPLQAKLADPITAPAAQSASTVSGARLLNLVTAYSGKMTATKAGMSEVTLGAPVTLAPNPTSATALLAVCKTGAATPNVAVYNFDVPAGALLARFELRQAETSAPGDDNDMLVLHPNGSTSTYSGADRTNEAAQIVQPAAGNYRVCVAAFGGQPTMSHQLSSWVLKPGAGATAGLLSVALPANVYAAGSASVGISWSGLASGRRYAGAVAFVDDTGKTSVSSTTVLLVNPGAAQAPQAEAGDTVSAKLGSLRD